ncbi:MAG: PQQ-binding-like beta-propeller repeat protein [Planctomycetota bacterium]
MSPLAFLLSLLVPQAPDPGPAPAARADWASYRGDPALNGVAPGTLALPLVERWSFQAGKGIVPSPVVAGGRLFVGCDDHQLYALDATSGALLWKHATKDIIEAPALVVGERVFVGVTDGNLLALDAASGEPRWQFQTGDKILGGANLLELDGEAHLVVGSYDANVYCLRAADGELRWKFETANYVNGTPAVAGEKIVFGGCDAILHVLDGRTGKELQALELGNDSQVAGSVALRDGLAYFGHYGNAFVCVDLEENRAVWSFPDPKQAFFSSPSVAGARVLFGGRNKQLHCVDAASGALQWKYATRRKLDSSPVVVGDQVVLGTADGKLAVLALADGAERWTADLGAELAGSVAVAGGWIYTADLDGRVRGFGPAPAAKAIEGSGQ